MLPNTNLEVIKKSRKPALPGDIFVMKLPIGYVFGRVITIDARDANSPSPGACLVHIYDLVRDEKDVPHNEILAANLLIAPAFVHRLTWRDGYFETISNAPVKQADRDRNCFWDALRERYIDENEQIVEMRAGPCGSWGLSSIRHLDDLISDAVGIARCPEF